MMHASIAHRIQQLIINLIVYVCVLITLKVKLDRCHALIYRCGEVSRCLPTYLVCTRYLGLCSYKPELHRGRDARNVGN